MKSILISVLGDDKPGLLDSLSEIIVSHDGDWVESCTALVEDDIGNLSLINWPVEREKLRKVNFEH